MKRKKACKEEEKRNNAKTIKQPKIGIYVERSVLALVIFLSRSAIY